MEHLCGNDHSQSKVQTLCVTSFGMNFKIRLWTDGIDVKLSLYISRDSIDGDCVNSVQQRYDI